MAYRSGSSTGYTTGTTASVTVPSGAASGDVAVVDLYVESTGAVTPPSGFTLDVSVARTDSPTWSHHRYWKRLTGADSGSYSFGLAASVPSMVACNLYTGRASTGSPFDTGSGATQSARSVGSAGAACPTLSITPTTAAVDLHYCAFDYNNGGPAAPAGWTTAATHADGVLTCYKLNQPASSSGSVSCSTPALDMWTVQLSALLLDTGGAPSPQDLILPARSWVAANRW